VRFSHHGNCYRVFNLWREVESHGYKASGTYTPASPWETMRAEAAALTANANTNE
jgi:hypothetical protein